MSCPCSIHFHLPMFHASTYINPLHHASSFIHITSSLHQCSNISAANHHPEAKQTHTNSSNIWFKKARQPNNIVIIACNKHEQTYSTLPAQTITNKSNLQCTNLNHQFIVEAKNQNPAASPSKQHQTCNYISNSPSMHSRTCSNLQPTQCTQHYNNLQSCINNKPWHHMSTPSTLHQFNISSLLPSPNQFQNLQHHTLTNPASVPIPWPADILHFNCNLPFNSPSPTHGLTTTHQQQFFTSISSSMHLTLQQHHTLNSPQFNKHQSTI